MSTQMDDRSHYRYGHGVCSECGILFSKRGMNHKRCDLCTIEYYRKYHRDKSNEWYYKRGRLPTGSGSNTGFGESNHMWRDGFGRLKNNIKYYKELWRYCNRCNTDLIDATHYMWCIHHKDYDQSNNDESNLELLCKKCHRQEHGNAARSRRSKPRVAR